MVYIFLNYNESKITIVSYNKAIHHVYCTTVVFLIFFFGFATNKIVPIKLDLLQQFGTLLTASSVFLALFLRI